MSAHSFSRRLLAAPVGWHQVLQQSGSGIALFSVTGGKGGRPLA